MGIYWLNLGSLLLGLLSLALPCFVICLHKRLQPLAVSLMSFFSLGACATSFVLQIFYNEHLTSINDWSALLDTAGALSRISGMLLLAALLLNAIAMGVFYCAGRWQRHGQ